MVELSHRYVLKQTSSTAHDVSSIAAMGMRSAVLGTPLVKTILHGARSPHCLVLEVRNIPELYVQTMTDYLCCSLR